MKQILFFFLSALYIVTKQTCWINLIITVKSECCYLRGLLIHKKITFACPACICFYFVGLSFLHASNHASLFSNCLPSMAGQKESTPNSKALNKSVTQYLKFFYKFTTFSANVCLLEEGGWGSCDFMAAGVGRFLIWEMESLDGAFIKGFIQNVIVFRKWTFNIIRTNGGCTVQGYQLVQLREIACHWLPKQSQVKS